MQRNALCRSRRELSNEYLLAKIGVDTAENEPLEVWGKIFHIIQLCPQDLDVLLLDEADLPGVVFVDDDDVGHAVIRLQIRLDLCWH